MPYLDTRFMMAKQATAIAAQTPAVTGIAMEAGIWRLQWCGIMTPKYFAFAYLKGAATGFKNQY